MEKFSYFVEDKDQEVKFKLPAYNNNEMLQITHVALYLRGLVILRDDRTVMFQY